MTRFFALPCLYPSQNGTAMEDDPVLTLYLLSVTVSRLLNLSLT